jgi:hypothetical protein
MTSKTCIRCSETKPTTEFYVNRRPGRRGDGFNAACKVCIRTSARDAYRTDLGRARDAKKRVNKRVKKVLLYREAKNHPCTDCGQTFAYPAMEFDHLPGSEKVNSVSRLAFGNLSWERAAEEIAKCELVCANCHNVRTYNRRCLPGEELPFGPI